VRLWLGVLVLNVALALLIAVVAPRDIGTTADREGYEYVEAHPLAPDCPHSIFCYRVLVPAVLSNVQAPDVVRWRAFSIVGNALTGTLLAGLAVAATRQRPAMTAVVASILYQASFGATFAVFDPFTPDAAVYLLAALLALLWWWDRPWLAMGVAVVGVFAKETIALVISAAALAAFFQPTERRRRSWLIAALVSWLAILVFHGVMDASAGWSERGSASANVFGGSWLGLWLSDSTLTWSARLLYLFIPFGFAWLYAVLGFGGAPRRLRSLALGSLLTIPVLVYVQTPERALATASFVVIPLAAIYLSGSSPLLGLAAAISNGLLTARVGLTTAWLPPLPYLLILAGTVAAVTIVSGALRSRALSTSTVLLASSRITSPR
jgi:hypothetical protein